MASAGERRALLYESLRWVQKDGLSSTPLVRTCVGLGRKKHAERGEGRGCGGRWESRRVRVASQSRRCSASAPQPPKKTIPVFSRAAPGSIKKTEIAILRLEGKKKKKKRNSGRFQKCMLTSCSPASPPPTPPTPSTPLSTYSLNTKALLYVLKHTSGYFTPPTEPPQTLQFSSLLLYTSRDERDKPSTALHYTQLWNQFDIDPGKLRCFPVFGQWLSFAFLLGMLVISRRRGKRQAGGRAGRRAVRQFSWGASFRSSVLHASLHPQSMFPPTEAAPPALCLRFHFWEPQSAHAYVQTRWRKQRQRTTVAQREGNLRNLDNSFGKNL